MIARVVLASRLPPAALLIGLGRLLLLNRPLSSVRRVGKVFSGIDVESETVSGTGFRKGALNCLVDIGASDGFKRDGLVACIHHGQILDVLQSLDSDAGFNPACSPVGEIVPAIGILVDGVGRVRIVRFDYLPRPGPGEIG